MPVRAIPPGVRRRPPRPHWTPPQGRPSPTRADRDPGGCFAAGDGVAAGAHPPDGTRRYRSLNVSPSVGSTISVVETVSVVGAVSVVTARSVVEAASAVPIGSVASAVAL